MPLPSAQHSTHRHPPRRRITRRDTASCPRVSSLKSHPCKPKDVNRFNIAPACRSAAPVSGLSPSPQRYATVHESFTHQKVPWGIYTDKPVFIGFSIHNDLTIGVITAPVFKKILIYIPCTKLSDVWMRCGKKILRNFFPIPFATRDQRPLAFSPRRLTLCLPYRRRKPVPIHRNVGKAVKFRRGRAAVKSRLTD